jgi:hypothetical protein
MNIKKIISEEVNDFKWVEDVPERRRLTKDNIEVGQRVIVTSNFEGINAHNQIGTVVEVNGSRNHSYHEYYSAGYTIDFDQPFSSEFDGSDNEGNLWMFVFDEYESKYDEIYIIG